MLSNTEVIAAQNVSKRFSRYTSPADRIKKSVNVRLRRLFKRPPATAAHEFTALDDVSFRISRGQTVGIVGRNGSGKSTLLQIVCGTLRPTSGTAITTGRIAALLELGAGFNPDYSGRENVYLNAAILGLSRRETENKLQAIIDFADIGDFFDQPVKTYSSGMFVRLAFATAINTDPEILIIDEALAVGDEAFQRKCFAKLKDIQDRGCTILFVSHSAQSVIELCDYAILLEQGRLLLQGDPKTVTSQYQRLVHAPHKEQDRIISDILKIGMTPKKPETANLINQRDSDAANREKKKEALDLEGFEPGLKSSSLVEYPQQGAEIKKIRVINALGTECNILVHGEKYELLYEIVSHTNIEKLNFAFALKTVSGFEISSEWKYPLGEGEVFEAEIPRTVKFSFVNRLLPGTYFLNAGIFTHRHGEFTQVHRIVDASMFKVAPYDFNAPKYGVVSLVPT